MGFTHVELMPITEHPFGGSWGYQPLSLFAPTARFGDAGRLRALRRRAATRPASASLLDWVPAHFPTDAHGLARFDGTALYEHARSARGLPSGLEHADLQFRPPRGAGLPDRAARCTGSSISTSTACASMRSPRCSIATTAARPANGCRTCYGGRENLEAIGFLRHLNAVVGRALPRRDDDRRGIDRLARRVAAGLRPAASAFPTSGTWAGCTTRCTTCERDPVHRAYHHDEMTFGLLYAFSENFILPLSHDEVVYGKAFADRQDAGRPLAELRQPARLFRLHVGASRQEAAVHGRRDRAGARMEPRRRARLAPARRSAARRHAAPGARSQPALSRASRRCTQRDAEADGFRWVRSATTAHNSVFAFLRCGGDADDAGPGRLQHDAGAASRLSHRRAARRAAGARSPTPTRASMAAATWATTARCTPLPVRAHGEPQSLELTLPPLATVMLRPED